MEPTQYLADILKGQDLKDDSQELKDLRTHRDDVETKLRNGFPKASASIRYGGSRAKGTLIKESYDLDIVFYVPNDNNEAGGTLSEIFDNVRNKLAENYYVEPKTSAIRLRGKDDKVDFHIDVVPGRYVDDSKSDCFIHQNGGDKDRLKTNLDVHVEHVRDSGVVPAVRLLKLWRVRRGLSIKQFVFELLVIHLLKAKKDESLDAQLKHVWTSLKEAAEPIGIEDPANPTGNDLSQFLKSAWDELSSRSSDTLDLLEESGWEAIFGAVEEAKDDKSKMDRVRRAAASVLTPTRPWLGVA
jgi:hypothetical protein